MNIAYQSLCYNRTFNNIDKNSNLKPTYSSSEAFRRDKAATKIRINTSNVSYEYRGLESPFDYRTFYSYKTRGSWND